MCCSVIETNRYPFSQPTATYVRDMIFIGDNKFLLAPCQSQHAERAHRAAPSELFELEYSIAALYRVLDETGS